MLQFLGVLISFVSASFVLISAVIMWKTFRETYRPYIFVSLRADGVRLYLVIENTGIRAAYNVSFHWTPSFVAPCNKLKEDDARIEEHIMKKLSSLAPKIKLEELIGDHDAYWKYKNLNPQYGIYQIQVVYFEKPNHKGKKYIESYTFDFHDYFSFLVPRNKQAETMSDIKKALQKISDSLEKLVQKEK